MKIIFITHSKISAQEGDSTHILEMALNLLRQGNDLLLICQGGKQISDTLKTRRLPGLRIKYLTSLFLDLISILYLFFYIRQFKPDIVYYRDVTMGGIVSWLLKVSSVAEANGIYPDIAKIERPRFFRIVSKFLLMRERIQYFRATRIICVTKGIKKELVKHYGVKNQICRVINNGVNTSLFKPMAMVACRKRLGIKQDCFYLGFVGSFKAWQGLDSLIKAMKVIKENGYKGIRCILVGDGNWKKRLKEMVNQYDLNSEIIFEGKIKYEDVPTFINSFDICYLGKTGLDFGFSPLKLYEYLSCAKPIIASKMEGISEIVENANCGYLFKPDDVGSLVSRIIECYNEREKLTELGMNGRRFIEDRFSWERIARKVQRVLKEAIEQNKRVID